MHVYVVLVFFEINKPTEQPQVQKKYFAPDGIVFWSLGLMSKGGCEYKDDPKHTMVLYHIHMSSPSNF